MRLSVRVAARERPNAPALVHDGTELTLAALAARVEERMRDFERRFRRGGVLTLRAEPELSSLIDVYTAIELGRPFSILHSAWADDQSTRALDVLAAHADALTHGAPGDEDDCLAVVFTSGTEGDPRGVALSRRAFVAAAEASAANLGWRDDDRWLLSLPLSHVGGLSIVTRCLVARRTMIVESTAGSFDPRRFADVLQRRRITLVSLVPTMLRLLLDLGPEWRPPESLRAVLLGGAAGSWEFVARAEARGLPVLTTYGLTEACSQVATRRLADRQSGRPGVGPVLPGVEIRTVAGRIEVRGPTLMSGYLGEPASALGPADWFRTSDLGEIAEDGWLTVHGRADEVIVTGGKKVHPREVERVLEEHPAIDQVVAFGLPDETWGEVVAVAITSDRPPQPEEIERFGRDRLATHQRPRAVAAVDSLPYLASGKIARSRVPELARPALRRIG